MLRLVSSLKKFAIILLLLISNLGVAVCPTFASSLPASSPLDASFEEKVPLSRTDVVRPIESDCDSNPFGNHLSHCIIHCSHAVAVLRTQGIERWENSTYRFPALEHFLVSTSLEPSLRPPSGPFTAPM